MKKITACLLSFSFLFFLCGVPVLAAEPPITTDEQFIVYTEFQTVGIASEDIIEQYLVFDENGNLFAGVTIFNAEDAIPDPTLLRAKSIEIFNNSYQLSIDSTTKICEIHRRNNFRDRISCYNNGPGAVTFFIKSSSGVTAQGSVDSGNGIQFWLYERNKVHLLASANWLNGSYYMWGYQAYD